jgi:GNAT superfamily N-acetyltransferase
VGSAFERRRGAFTVSTDRSRLDLDAVHGFLAGSYWAAGIPREVVARSVAGSLCFGLYEEAAGGAPVQIGFARAITDAATYAYLADVFVLDSHRGRGLGAWLMECVMAHPDLQGLRRWSLVTRDAHALYARFGFVIPRAPERYMEKVDADVYRGKPGG